MYPEFIPIYIGLIIIIAMLVYILILLKSTNENKTVSMSSPKIQRNVEVKEISFVQNEVNMAFCKKCATQFDASLKSCPHCGTPR